MKMSDTVIVYLIVYVVLALAVVIGIAWCKDFHDLKMPVGEQFALGFFWPLFALPFIVRCVIPAATSGIQSLPRLLATA